MSKIVRYINVAVYIRKSRKDTDTLEETLARHSRILNDYCQRNKLIVKHIYREVVSGDRISERPQMQKLLKDVEAGMYEGVVVIELERLSRGNPVDQFTVSETFKQSNTKIFTLNKIYDLGSDNEFDEDFFEMGLFMSRREYNTIKRRLLRGRLQAQKEGYFIGSKIPFGFNKKRDETGFVLVPDDDEMQVVNLIFNKYVSENWSLTQISTFLNENKITTRYTTIWDAQAVKRILKNVNYIGYIRTNAKKSTKDIQYIKAKHNAVIDPKIFELAQEKLKIKSVKLKKNYEIKNPLASLVRCGVCGLSMQKAYHQIRCINPNCSNVLSYFDDIEKQVIEELKKELSNFNYFIENYQDEVENKKRNIENDIELLKKELTKKDKMINKACELLEMGIYSKEKYLSRVNILEEEKSILEANMDELEASLLKVDSNAKIKKAIPILEKVLDEYWNLDTKSKNDLLKTIIDKIEYKKTSRNNRWNKNLSDLELKIFLKI